VAGSLLGWVPPSQSPSNLRLSFTHSYGQTSPADPYIPMVAQSLTEGYLTDAYRYGVHIRVTASGTLTPHHGEFGDIPVKILKFR
jgi:hypothetical protein